MARALSQEATGAIDDGRGPAQSPDEGPDAEYKGPRGSESGNHKVTFGRGPVGTHEEQQRCDSGAGG